jgi:CheY-like chemotaxis protein
MDLDITDIQMPEMDGLQFIRTIRKLCKETGVARVPIIALSANVSEADIEKAIAAGADKYLAKPLVQEALWKAISELVTK